MFCGLVVDVIGLSSLGRHSMYLVLYQFVYDVLATFLSSMALVCGHCISRQLIGTNTASATDLAYTTPNSGFAVVKKYDRASPIEITCALITSPGLKDSCILTLSISLDLTSCDLTIPEYF